VVSSLVYQPKTALRRRIPLNFPANCPKSTSRFKRTTHMPSKTQSKTHQKPKTTPLTHTHFQKNDSNLIPQATAPKEIL
jgi:hypothetical protein